MQDDPPPPSRSLVWTTAKAAAAIAVLSVAATQFLSGTRLDRTHMGTLIAQATQTTRDPVTTGSIGSAATLRLDPCSTEPRR